MSTVDIATKIQPPGAPTTRSSDRAHRILCLMPHVLVWTLLLVPTIRSMVRGWRPLGDDAAIAIGAWRSLTLHPPLLGQLTFATSAKGNADPGPLEFWMLGPFAHIDPGQGVLIGSAILCLVALSVTIEVLRRTSGVWAGIVFSLVIADLAIISPSPFLDPVWNSSFGFFWFASFLGIAFAVGYGNVGLYPLLLFIGSVAVDSHLLYLPAVACLLFAVPICGWSVRRPSNHRWIGWTVVVAAVCWAGPLYQQFFDARPNITALLRNSGVLGGGSIRRTEGWTLGFRGLGRIASLNPIWASPRPIQPFISSNDFAHRSISLGLLLVSVLIAIGVIAWRLRQRAIVSMCVVSLGGMLGTVVLLSSVPVSYYLAFVWVNLDVWIVGICVWLTLGLTLITAIRGHAGAVVRSRAGPYLAAVHRGARGLGVALVFVVAGVAGLLVLLFPYGNQPGSNWTGVARVKRMAADVEHHVPKGPVGIGMFYSGNDPFQTAADEHGVAYLLLTDGWTPGLESQVNQRLSMPIRRKSPFVVFTEQGEQLLGAKYLPRYQSLWSLDPRLRV